MTPNLFAELQAKYPLVKQLIGALDLELDNDYYSHPDRRKEKAISLAKTLLENGFLKKDEVLGRLKKMFPDTADKKDFDKAILDFWLKNKIVNTGYAYFGTARQVRQEIIFIGDCPF